MTLIVDIKKDFLSFLKEKDIIEPYFENLCKNKDSIIEFFKHTSPVHLIDNAFNWVDTFEGICFWMDVDSQWTERFHESIDDISWTFSPKDIEEFIQPDLYGKFYCFEGIKCIILWHHPKKSIYSSAKYEIKIWLPKAQFSGIVDFDPRKIIS